MENIHRIRAFEFILCDHWHIYRFEPYALHMENKFTLWREGPYIPPFRTSHHNVCCDYSVKTFSVLSTVIDQKCFSHSLVEQETCLGEIMLNTMVLQAFGEKQS